MCCEDGRVLFESGFPLGAGATPEMYLVYPDGSGVESVRCDHPNAEKGGGREHGRQNIGFGGRGPGTSFSRMGERLARFTSPLADEAPIASPAGEFAGDVAELPDGRWMLAMRRPGRGTTHWRHGSRERSAATVVARDAERDLVGPVGGRAAPVAADVSFRAASVEDGESAGAGCAALARWSSAAACR